MRLTVRTSVDVDLRAFHTDPHMDEGRHEHVWNVRAVFDGAKFADARALRLALANLLSAYQGQDLPPELWSGESIAQMVVNVLGTGDPIGCVVTRPGFRAEAWLR
ncbi:hypothetical protein [Synechococcus phage Yong-M4-211]|nr:hypothetical protein [Synechococcus phage Yong-M4-211]